MALIPEKHDPHKNQNNLDMIWTPLAKVAQEKAAPHPMGGAAMFAMVKGISQDIARRKLGQMVKHQERWTAMDVMAKAT